MKDVDILLNAFIRWKKSNKIKVGARLGYGSKEEFKNLIEKGVFFVDQRVSRDNIKNWYHISESGIKILQDFENVGLSLMNFSGFEAKLNDDMKIKVCSIYENFEQEQKVA